MDWIRVQDDMPKEEDSIFLKYYGTEKWKAGMFRTISKQVLITFETERGEKVTCTGKVVDGKWKTDVDWMKGHVTHWMPFPEPAKGE